MKSENIRYQVVFNKTLMMSCQFNKDSIRRSYERYLKLRRYDEKDISKDLNLRQYVKEYILLSIYENIEWRADEYVSYSREGGIRI